MSAPPMLLRLLTMGFVIAGLTPTEPAFADERAKGIEFFESRIRPVLIEHCYECHSRKSKAVKGGLKLDDAAALKAGGDSGAIVVPGKPAESLLIDALKFDGLEMPPSGRLPASVVRDFEKWIQMGVPDPRTAEPSNSPDPVDRRADAATFWSFQPLKTAPVPAVSRMDWPASDIDRFILSKLEQAGLSPTRDVDRDVLVRRLYFDLIGLPPTPEQIHAFENDSTPTALETVVDRLIDSPHYAEHWARHWLDVARYSDSNGGDFNATFHNAWRYRDYVIEAFHQDKPFDQFVREQIAGDLMESEDDDQRTERLVATGFLMIGPKMLSERDKEKLRMDVVDDQIDTVGRAFMGLTLGCARCHDHKFDPVPTEDYYALAGIFRSTQVLDGEFQQYVSKWLLRPLPVADDHAKALKQYAAEKKRLGGLIVKAEQRAKTGQGRNTFDAKPLGIVVDDDDAELVGEWKTSTHTPRYIGSGYRHDDRTGKGRKSIIYRIPVKESGLYDVRLSYTPSSGRASSVPVVVEHADGTTTVMLNQVPKPPIRSLFKSIGKFTFDASKPASVTIKTTNTRRHVIADAVQCVPVDLLANSDGFVPLTESPADSSPDIQQAQAELKKLKQQLAALEATKPPPAPMAIAVGEASDVADCELRIRGEVHNKGQTVPRGFVRAASADGSATTIAPKTSGRLELAEWMTSRKHPLTARVIVNRVWHHLLGAGLVRSVDNFGRLGDRPSHPELLDRLTKEFIDDGWSIKRLVRRIVLSRTYRMASDFDRSSHDVDPENRLLWRAHRRRVPAEALRDSLLAISGQLDRSPGGSPVKGLGKMVTDNGSNAKDYEQRESRLRTVYTAIVRNELPTILSAFDFADPDLVSGSRPSTTVPTQALFLLNSPFVRHCAELTANRIADEYDSDGERVHEAWLGILGRRPTADEFEHAVEFVKNAAAADDSEKRRGWTELVQMLFASTEFRFLD